MASVSGVCRSCVAVQAAKEFDYKRLVSKLEVPADGWDGELTMSASE